MDTTFEQTSQTLATSTLSIQRSPATGSRGAIAGKMAPAVEAGAGILAAGGNAIDAAVATAFAMGVVEPWMNGLGGGGFIVGWLAEERRSFAIEYPMISPSGATPDMYPLSGGMDAGLFGWPKTKDNANVLGYRSIAVPGTVAGLAEAVERHGTMSLSQVLEPAIALAEGGIPVSWHTTLMVARDLVNLRAFPETARVFLDANGCPPVTIEQVNPAIIHNLDLARTLRAIADSGAREFYEGALGRSLVDHLKKMGTPVTARDFAQYQAVVAPTNDVSFSGHTVHTIGKGTGGTSLAESLGILERLDLRSSGHNTLESLHKMTHAFRQAFADRFTYLADPDHCDVPLDALTSDAYLRSRADRFDPYGLASTAPGTREELGVTHALEGSVADYIRDGSTTHLGVIDQWGNAVSLTQTLLSGWGSRVTVPGTGVLMNNGMMWFDPEPGRPNSVGPGKRPLTNMAPALVTRSGQIRASVGSSGGRKIVNCNAQLIANIAAFGLSLGEALAAPRIDASQRPLAVSSRIELTTRQRLVGIGHPVQSIDETLLTSGFASPVGIARDEDGSL
ncbi:MAG: gamma-glutamyltransferase family protein, partial [Chloroflexota bacterium]|nr:gamma-glutamyltransferase family protein [Chloroflexota bacterium]